MRTRYLSNLVVILGLVITGLTAQADVTGEFDKLCGNVVSNAGCSDVATEYSVIFGSASAAVALAKNQGLLTSANSCKTKLKGGDPKLQYVLSVIDTISGSGVGHFVDCACNIVFSDTSCSSSLSQGAEEVAKGFSSFGQAFVGELKKIGCSLGLGGCKSLTPEQKKAIYFACRQYGFSELEIWNLDVFGFKDPSGKAYKDFSKSAMCFMLPLGADDNSMNYLENTYQSFLACGFHKGVANEDPGNPKYTGYRACMDGATCTSKKLDSWNCKPGHIGAHPVPGPSVFDQKKARALSVASRLGSSCAIAPQDPFQVSCASFERYATCLKSLGSCKSSNGINWDDACCRLAGSGAGAPPQVKKARAMVEAMGPSCDVNSKDPVEVDCATAGTWAKCRQTLGDCKASNGWTWDGACCRLKGGNTNPSSEYRRALNALKKIGGKDAKIYDLDAVEVRCRTVKSYAACTKELPNACHTATGHEYWERACCRLHAGAGY